MKHLSLPILCLLTVFLTGCATVSDYTLPASQTESYDYDTFSVSPPKDPAWRLNYSNKENGTLSFLHVDYNSNIFFWASPVLKANITEEMETDIIDYFQQELLKETKLQPDIIISDQDIKRREHNIKGIPYKVLDIDFKVEKEELRLLIYYHLAEDESIIYNSALFIDKDKRKKDDSYEDLIKKSEKILSEMEFRKPKDAVLVRMRAMYAMGQFLSSLDDKYLAEKVNSVQRKFDTAEEETKSWIRKVANNYWGYNNLGVLKTFNDKFEEYGDGFDSAGAERDFKKALNIREHYHSPHFNLAKMYKALGEKEKSIQHYKAAIAISPNNENLYYELGQIYEEMGDRDKAGESYQDAIRHWGSGFKTLDEVKLKLKNWDKEK